MKWIGGVAALWVAVAVLTTAPVSAQFLQRPIRPQVKPPEGPVRQVIFKNCTSCHGIDDYAYYALDKAGWNSLLERKHQNLAQLIPDADRQVLLDWLAMRFGAKGTPFPRTYVPVPVTVVLSDAQAQDLLNASCTECHGLDRVDQLRNNATQWRLLLLDMRERGAMMSDMQMEQLVEWLGRNKGTNAS